MIRIMLIITLIFMALTMVLAANHAAADSLDQWPATLVWSTLLGSEHSEKGLSITLDSAGNLLVTGRTRSPFFPTTPGCYDSTHGGMTTYLLPNLTLPERL